MNNTNLILEMVAVTAIFIPYIIFMIILRKKKKNKDIWYKYAYTTGAIFMSVCLLIFEGIWLTMLLGGRV